MNTKRSSLDATGQTELDHKAQKHPPQPVAKTIALCGPWVTPDADGEWYFPSQRDDMN